MAVVVDANFIMETCAVFGVMCTIFGFFWAFVIYPVIKDVSKAVDRLGETFKIKIDGHDGTLMEHGRRITDVERGVAVVSTRIEDHLEQIM